MLYIVTITSSHSGICATVEATSSMDAINLVIDDNFKNVAFLTGNLTITCKPKEQ